MKYNANTANGLINESSLQTSVGENYFGIQNTQLETYWVVDRVLDGDSLMLRQEFGQYEKEIRLYGLDAPEVSINRKMKEDEARTGIPSYLLQQYGLMSLDFVLQICPPNTRVSLITENKYKLDYWKRQLAYVILPNGDCLNEKLISEGWAKTTQEYYCEKLSYFQGLNFTAKKNKLGIYQFIDVF